MQRLGYVAWYGLSGDRLLDRGASWLRTSLENDESLSDDEFLDPYPETSLIKDTAAWKTRARSCIQSIENIPAIASLINFIAFLTGGKYRTLFERILRIRVVPRSRSSPMSNANFEYMNRDFMSYMIPLVNLVRIRRKMMVAGTAFTRSILKRIQEPKTASSKTANSHRNDFRNKPTERN
ncbi:peroxisome assembly protein (Peroxin-2) [Chytriomyces hyalinus]|nr:peroxisome assembly protein (Peroxin-2) [Chytriomyces hyalinus]